MGLGSGLGLGLGSGLGLGFAREAHQLALLDRPLHIGETLGPTEARASPRRAACEHLARVRVRVRVRVKGEGEGEGEGEGGG